MTSTADKQSEQAREAKGSSVGRTLGLGIITGAADDDCSAIGTYASAGAKFGPANAGPEGYFRPYHPVQH